MRAEFKEIPKGYKITLFDGEEKKQEVTIIHNGTEVGVEGAHTEVVWFADEYDKNNGKARAIMCDRYRLEALEKSSEELSKIKEVFKLLKGDEQ